MLTSTEYGVKYNQVALSSTMVTKRPCITNLTNLDVGGYLASIIHFPMSKKYLSTKAIQK